MQNIKNWFWGSFTVLIVVVIIGVLFFVMPTLSSLGGSFSPARTVVVTAQGQTTATPDEANISFSVLTQGANPQTLASSNTDKMNAVLQFVSSEGIASSDIATTNYDLEPNYSYDKNTSRNYITGYTLTQTVQVKIRDLTKVADVIAGLTPLGVNQIGSVEFTFQNPQNIVDIARGIAMTNAQKEASELAAQGAASLGPVVSIQESYGFPSPLPYAYASNGMSAAAAPSVPTIEPGTQNVTDSVTVTYELR